RSLNSSYLRDTLFRERWNPLATGALPGQRDDRLCRPIIDRICTSLGRSGPLYVGDSKLGALETRAPIPSRQ
ncbi:MAG: hypothetical protein SNJ69_01150, partial [Chloroflexaceae bacterium]